jgi:ribosome-associated toxin RatA of RatAB toxin-antitoxin module
VADEAHERIHIAAPVDVCFELASDFEGYPAWASDIKHARVVERDAQGRGTRADFRAAALGRNVRYVLDYDLSDAPRSFSWQLVEGDMLRTVNGRYTFDDVDEGTDVAYDLTVDLAIPMPGLVKRRAAGRIVGAALQDLKHAAEARVAVAGAPVPEPVPEPVSEPEPVLVVDPDPSSDHWPEPDPEPEREPESETRPAPGDGDGDAPAQGTRFDDVGAEERWLPLPSSIEVVLSELLGAVPEVRDHLLAAADELLDAAKALLDAADRVVRQQREGSP